MYLGWFTPWPHWPFTPEGGWKKVSPLGCFTPRMVSPWWFTPWMIHPLLVSPPWFTPFWFNRHGSPPIRFTPYMVRPTSTLDIFFITFFFKMSYDSSRSFRRFASSSKHLCLSWRIRVFQYRNWVAKHTWQLLNLHFIVLSDVTMLCSIKIYVSTLLQFIL